MQISNRAFFFQIFRFRKILQDENVLNLKRFYKGYCSAPGRSASPSPDFERRSYSHIGTWFPLTVCLQTKQRFSTYSACFDLESAHSLQQQPSYNQQVAVKSQLLDEKLELELKPV